MNCAQHCFDGLDVSVDIEEPESITSYESSYTGSISSMGYSYHSSIGSISGVLSAAMATALNFPADTHSVSTSLGIGASSEICDKTSIDYSIAKLNSADNLLNAMRANPKPITTVAEPVDFEWLFRRCDGDRQLVLEVLQSFCEQGQIQLSAMQSSIHNFDFNRLMFHAVIVSQLSIHATNVYRLNFREYV